MAHRTPQSKDSAPYRLPYEGSVAVILQYREPEESKDFLTEKRRGATEGTHDRGGKDGRDGASWSMPPRMPLHCPSEGGWGASPNSAALEADLEFRSLYAVNGHS
eukprot:1347146-Rhodomonas_salina.5